MSQPGDSRIPSGITPRGRGWLRDFKLPEIGQKKGIPPPPTGRRLGSVGSSAVPRRRFGSFSGAKQKDGSERDVFTGPGQGTREPLQFPRHLASDKTGQQSMGGRPALPSLIDDTDNSMIGQPHSQYVQYDRDRRLAAKPPMSAYDAYDPYPHPGSHQQYGVPEEKGYEYPYPSTSSLGQSQTGYTEQHPSEEFLPRAQDEVGRRAVYGIHEGRPVPGVGAWEHYFRNWKDVGQQYKVDIPKDEPLTQEELQFAQKYGFSFEKELGRGSFGTVWLVLATRLFTEPVPKGDPIKYVPKRLACKVLSLKTFREATSTIEVSVRNLVREADIHQQLDHRNIVKCEHIFHIHDQITGFPYVRLLMMMELCDGDLTGLLERQITFDEKQAMDMMNDVCDALQYMHDRNICHLDIKTENIMYVREGGDHICYKLADFGVSKKYVSEDAAKVYGNIGTRMYMAPELQRIPKETSESKPTDIYSLGCVLAEVLTGRSMFRHLFKDLRRVGVMPSVYNKWKLGLICTQLISKMIDQNPKNRLTIAQVRQDPWFANN